MNLALSLLYVAERPPDAEALVGQDERLSYAGLRERAARIAAGLGERAVRRRDRVACVLKNHAETVELYWATQWLGASAIAYAGAGMTSALAERCTEVFRPRVFVNHYGSTEIYTFSVHRDQRAKPGCVVARPGVTADDLDAFCLASQTLARFKRPREYRFVDVLPKSPSGKILRRTSPPPSAAPSR